MTILIDHHNAPNVDHAITGVRYLIQGGVIDPRLSNTTDPTYTEGHARSIHGLRADGSHLILKSEGVYPNQGMTLLQGATILFEHGAVVAFDSGGGGDVTCDLDGKSLIVPENIDPTTNLHFERFLPSALLIYAKDVTMTRYTATAIGDNTKLRPNHNTLSDFNPVQAFPAKTKFYGDFVWIADATNKDASQSIGDIWLQVTSGSSSATIVGWVAIIHQGKPICTLVDSGVTPPPTTGTVSSVEMTLTAGSVLRVKDEFGNILYTVTA